MTKTKGFLLTAGIVLATTFTLFACSDDKNDPPTGKTCYADTSPIPGVKMCMDQGKTITQADCDQGSNDDMRLTLREESCPSDYELDCDKRGTKIYFYGEAASSITCAVLDN